MRKLNPLCVAFSAALVLGLGLLTSTASATPVGVVNGATQIQVTSFGTLTGPDFGLTVAPGGTAVLPPITALVSPIVFYDVTEVDLTTGEVFHQGAQLDISLDGATVALSNFNVNAGEGFVFADVVTSTLSTNAPILKINKVCSLEDPCAGLDGTLSIGGLELTVTDIAASVLSDELGIDDLTNAAFGVATTTFTPVPEPGTAALLLIGLVAMGASRQSRSAQPR